MTAAAEYATDLTVNEAEYREMQLGIDLLTDQTQGRIIICGYSNIVIRHMRKAIGCKAPGLTLLRHKATEKLRSWPIHNFLHIKKDWNQNVNLMTRKGLQQA